MVKAPEEAEEKLKEKNTTRTYSKRTFENRTIEDQITRSKKKCGRIQYFEAVKNFRQNTKR